MKDIKLGNDIYNNVEHIQFKDKNDNIVTFVDESVYTDKYVSANFANVELGFNAPTVEFQLEYLKVEAKSNGATIE